jgi:uracil-DNA glycosylase
MTDYITWDDLHYWKTGEWQVVEERLKESKNWNPGMKKLFAAMKRTPFHLVRVMIIGQDPYPNAAQATGVAFEVPDNVPLPPTLINLFEEYSNDLHYPTPTSGDLKKWTEQGVMLWNAYPSCQTGKPKSHQWPEWEFLTKEIIQLLSARKCVFVALGNVAASFLQSVTSSPTVITSHPSPLGARRGSVPFTGSRLFSTINGKLCSIGEQPINWRL